MKKKGYYWWSCCWKVMNSALQIHLACEVLLFCSKRVPIDTNLLLVWSEYLCLVGSWGWITSKRFIATVECLWWIPVQTGKNYNRGQNLRDCIADLNHFLWNVILSPYINLTLKYQQSGREDRHTGSCSHPTGKLVGHYRTTIGPTFLVPTASPRSTEFNPKSGPLEKLETRNQDTCHSVEIFVCILTWRRAENCIARATQIQKPSFSPCSTTS